jgi:hypothetical protein
MEKPRKLSARQIEQLIIYANALADMLGCAGPPACEEPSVDAATGKREGGLCTACEALEWLGENKLMLRTPPQPEAQK